MNNEIRLLDIVALIEPMHEKRLAPGQVGTVVGVLAPNILEMEFPDDTGQAYGFASVPGEKLLPLHHRPVRAAS